MKSDLSTSEKKTISLDIRGEKKADKDNVIAALVLLKKYLVPLLPVYKRLSVENRNRLKSENKTIGAVLSILDEVL